MKIFLYYLFFSLSFLFAEELSLQDIYLDLTTAYENKQWENLKVCSQDVLMNHAGAYFAHDAIYFLGIAYFNLSELDLASKQFSSYLKKKYSPKFFLQALNYKFLIAERYRAGEKKRILGFKNLPKMVSGKEDSLSLYDEIISIVPNHELAMKSLYGKAKILSSTNELKESMETFQKLIRDFPKSAFAIESFIEIGDIFLRQTTPKHQNPDLLDMAKLNLKKFKSSFPGEPRTEEVEKKLLQMKEIHAQGLYEIGRFFERTKKPKASILYYSKIVSLFPETTYAKLSQERLHLISK